MSDIVVSLDGGRRVTAHLAEGFSIVTDQPVDEGGGGTAPTPIDYFLASLATCAGVYVSDFCSHRNIPVGDITMHQSAEWSLDDNGKHHLVSVALRVKLPDTFPDKYRSAIVRVAEMCTVKHTVLNPPRFSVELL